MSITPDSIRIFFVKCASRQARVSFSSFISPEFHSGIPLFPFRRFTFGFDFVSYQGYYPVSIPLGAQPAKRFLFLGSFAGYHPAAHSCESSRSLIVHFCRIIATTILFVLFAEL